jgi:hypothetical protein
MKNRLWDVYEALEPHLTEGRTITANQAWSYCGVNKSGVRYCGMTGCAAIQGHFRDIMNILIGTGHVVKLKRGVWFIKNAPKNDLQVQ